MRSPRPPPYLSTLLPHSTQSLTACSPRGPWSRGASLSLLWQGSWTYLTDVPLRGRVAVSSTPAAVDHTDNSRPHPLAAPPPHTHTYYLRSSPLSHTHNPTATAPGAAATEIELAINSLASPAKSPNSHRLQGMGRGSCHMGAIWAGFRIHPFQGLSARHLTLADGMLDK